MWDFNIVTSFDSEKCGQVNAPIQPKPISLIATEISIDVYACRIT